MSEIDKYRDKKEDFIKDFEELRPDYFIPQLYEKDSQRELVAEEVRPSKTKSNMFFSIPMRCRGSKCPIANSCPLLKKNVAPVGSKCPIELAMISDLAHGLMKELNVDSDSFVEISMIRDLVNEEIQQIRASNILADEDFIQENFVGMTPDGEPILQKGLNLAIEWNSKILKHKADIRKQLMATREQRAKIGASQIDSTQVISKLLEGVREHELTKEKELRKRLGMSTQDDYILSQQEIIDAEIVPDPPKDENPFKEF